MRAGDPWVPDLRSLTLSRPGHERAPNRHSRFIDWLRNADRLSLNNPFDRSNP